MHACPQTVVVVPGLRGHDDDHWQTHLAAALPSARCVPPLGRTNASLDERIELIEQAVSVAAGPVLVVAHSAGVLATVHWAARHPAAIVGALLATPPALAAPLPTQYPSIACLRDHGWLPIPRRPLPFPSVVAASSNDPLGNPVRVRALAKAWGSRLVDIGPVGHLNPAAGYGPWPAAERLLRELGARASGPDRGTATALGVGAG